MHLKRCVAALAFAATTPLAAQAKLGFVGGVVSTNVSGKDGGTTFDFSSSTGLAVGLSLTMGAPERTLRFAPELLYVMKGASEKPASTNAKLKLTYAEAPLLVRAGFKTSSSSFRPFVLAGPSVAFLLSCKSVDNTHSEECDDDFTRSIDFGVMVGAGANFGRVGVSVRYDLGLSNVSKASGESLKNRALMLLASFSL